MVTMNMISYEDERLGFFADQRRVVQKRYDRLEKQIKPDEPYTSERREFLADCGRELSFYNDVIEMLESGVVSKSEHDKAIDLWADNYSDAVDKWERAYEDLEIDFENAKTEVATKIFEDIDRFIYRYLNDADYSGGDMIYDITELKNKYPTE